MKRRSGGKRALAAALCGVTALAVLSGCSAPQSAENTQDPTAITVWHYYNGAQQQVFNELVEEFNETAGAEAGIVVESHSYGSVGELTQGVEEAIYEKVGADLVPDVFASYADTAYEINQAGMAADLSQYLTQEEQDAYISAYLDEGRFGDTGLQIFPVAKSAEVLILNKTEWDAFAAATGASDEGLATWEGIAALAEQYYQWSDGLTPDVPDDGKSFFGRDAFANYIIIGSMQLGVELFRVEDGQVTLQIDRGVMRRLWDNYYVPFVNGYYAAYGNFRSDDMRTGKLAASWAPPAAPPTFPAR